MMALPNQQEKELQHGNYDLATMTKEADGNAKGTNCCWQPE
jgi:hypothetical protein